MKNCTHTGKPLSQCAFTELPETLRQSEYEPTLGGYQSACNTCKIVRFHAVEVEACPVCRGYELEKSWCEHCNKTGLVRINRHTSGN